MPHDLQNSLNISPLFFQALLLSNVSRKRFSAGEVINLMSADAQQLMDLTANLNLLWSAPFQILMAVSLLWQELGPAVLAGVAVLVFVIPINALVATRVKKLKVRKRQPRVTCVKQKLSFLTGVDNNHLVNSVHVEIIQIYHSFIHSTSIDWTSVLCRSTAVRRTDKF